MLASDTAENQSPCRHCSAANYIQHSNTPHFISLKIRMCHFYTFPHVRGVSLCVHRGASETACGAGGAQEEARARISKFKR